jgi:CHAT domain-containing protein
MRPIPRLGNGAAARRRAAGEPAGRKALQPRSVGRIVNVGAQEGAMLAVFRNARHAVLLLAAGVLLCQSGRGEAQTGRFAPPPRSIADITALLAQEKPDEAKLAKLRADADAPPPETADARELARFHFARAKSEAALNRALGAIADLKAAIKYGADSGVDLVPLYRYLGSQLSWVGNRKAALVAFTEGARLAQERGSVTWTLHLQRWMSSTQLLLGRMNEGAALVAKMQALIQEARQTPQYEENRARWEDELEEAEARLFDAQGDYHRAELRFRSARALKAQSRPMSVSADPLDAAEIHNSMAYLLAREGLTKARRGRLAEAEADVRSALLHVLRTVGKYNSFTPYYLGSLGNILADQGRLAEAEQLYRIALEVCHAMGFPNDLSSSTTILFGLGELLSAQNRWDEAARTYAAVDEATRNWTDIRYAFVQTPGRIDMFYATGEITKGVQMAEALLATRLARFGADHFYTAIARGYLAIGLARMGREAEARAAFGQAIPPLVDALHGDQDADGVTAVSREKQIRNVVENYLALLARASEQPLPQASNSAFELADAIRGKSVEAALLQSSARAAANNPELSRMARREQDLAKQIGAHLGLLNNILAQAPDRRDEHAVVELNDGLNELRRERQTVQAEIDKRFPQYAAFTAPRAASIADVRRSLAAGEAFISIYVGREQAFVWAIPADGPVAFATVPLGETEMAAKVEALRKALDPHAAVIEDIPAFDFALAHELFARLLAPVEAAWRPARILVVSANGALGSLPMSVLTTAPFTLKIDGEIAFADYRRAPWLLRTHAVSQIPSATAWLSLRQSMPAPRQRESLIAFGDPIFSEEQARARPEREVVVAAADDSLATATRGVALSRRAVPEHASEQSVELAMLPALPDTAAELQAIARALGADPAQALYLGKRANEHNVRGMDLSHYRVIAFATHGLVPGDLDGLTQPALALTAPAIAGVDGDGLLTMEEILGLELDADWVVLSACNTGAGAAAGAEAASGLARAFFYAGTRSVLVTGWPVHSQSARALVSDLFRRQADDATLTRAQALQQAMLGLLDGPGYVDASGKSLFSYGHPLFWAPYVVIGDSGAAK